MRRVINTTAVSYPSFNPAIRDMGRLGLHHALQHIYQEIPKLNSARKSPSQPQSASADVLRLPSSLRLVT